jgi:4-amino-4-deoxy-L-arabinose transferase-like glycosyltransferase
MNQIVPTNFMFALLAFFAWLFAVLFTGYKSGYHAINPSKKWGVVFWVVTFFPTITLLLLINSKNHLWDYYLIAFIAPYSIRYFYSKPKMVIKREEVNLKYQSLNLTTTEPRFSFSPIQSTVIFNGDIAVYANWLWPYVTLNRVCKNTYSEYFWVHQQQAYGEVTIKHLTIEAAKNLMRRNNEAFINEFGSEPYA